MPSADASRAPVPHATRATALVRCVERAELQILRRGVFDIIELQRVRVHAPHLRVLATNGLPGQRPVWTNAGRRAAEPVPPRTCSVLRTRRMSLLQLSMSASMAMSLTCVSARRACRVRR